MIEDLQQNVAKLGKILQAYEMAILVGYLSMLFSTETTQCH
jgi:hypothetical protein